MKKSIIHFLIILISINFYTKNVFAINTFSLPLEITNELGINRENEYITSGIPIPQEYEIKSTDLFNITDENSNIIPSQITISSRWFGDVDDQTKAVRWIFVTFQANAKASQTAKYYLTYGQENTTYDAINILSNDNNKLVIDTNKAVFEINKKNFSLFDSVKINNEEIVKKSDGFTLKDKDGQIYSSSNSPTDISILESGPLMISLKASGKLSNTSNKSILDYDAYIYLYGNESLAKVIFTLGNHNKAALRDPCCGYQVYDFYGSNSVTFQDLSLNIELNSSNNLNIKYPSSNGEKSVSGDFTIYQDSSGTDYWNRYDNSDNPRPNSYSIFKGYKVTNDSSEIDSGDQFDGWLNISNNENSLTFGIVDFWQNFPKALEAKKDGTLKLKIFPEEYAGDYNFRVGEEKSTEIVLDFNSNNSNIQGYLNPMLALADSKWYIATKAVDYFIPEDLSYEERLGDYGKLDLFEKYNYYNDRSLASDPNYKGTYYYTFKSLIDSIKYFNFFGWYFYGNQPIDFEMYADGKAGPFDTKYNFSEGAWIQFLRTKDLRWKNLAESFSKNLETLMLHEVETETGWDIYRWKNAVFSHEQHNEQGNTNGARNYIGPVIDNAGNSEGAIIDYYLTGYPITKKYADKFNEYAYNFFSDQDYYKFGKLWNGDERPYSDLLAALNSGAINAGDKKYANFAYKVIDYLRPENQSYINGTLDPSSTDMSRPWMLAMYLVELGKFADIAENFDMKKESDDAKKILLTYTDWILKNTTYEYEGYLTQYYSYYFNQENKQDDSMINNWMLVAADMCAYAYKFSGDMKYLDYGEKFFKTGVENPFFYKSPLIYSTSKEAVNHAVFGNVYEYFAKLKNDPAFISLDDSFEIHDSVENNPTGNDSKDYENHWAKDYIEELFSRNIVEGCGNGNFCPDNNISRAELLKIALNLNGIEIEQNLPNPFTDLNKNHWAYNIILTAYDKKIINGYSNGTFKPNSEINRAEALKIIFGAADITPPLNKNGSEGFDFQDVHSSDWFYNYVMEAYENKIAEGYTINNLKYFKPDNSITRAEAAKMIILREKTL